MLTDGGTNRCVWMDGKVDPNIISVLAIVNVYTIPPRSQSETIYKINQGW